MLSTSNQPADTVPSTFLVRVILVAVLASQLLMTAAIHFDSSLVMLLWGALCLLGSGGLATGLLLRSPAWRTHLVYLTTATVLAAWVALVQFTSQAPALSVYPSWAWWSALLLVPVARLAWTRSHVGVLLVVVVLPAAIYAVWRAWVALNHPAGHHASGPDPNLLADRLAVLVFLAMLGTYALLNGPSSRVLQKLAVPVMATLVVFVAVLLQQALAARAVMLALVVGIAFLAWPSFRRLWWLPALPVAVFLLTVMFPSLLSFGAGGGPVGVEQFGEAALERARGDRLALWRAAIELAPAGLLTGTGLNTFGILYPPLRGPDDMTTGLFVHNDWLQLTLEAGLPFSLALLAIAVVILLGWLRALRAVTRAGVSDANALLALATLTSSGLLLAHACINFPFYDPVLLGLLTVCSTIGLSAGASSGTRPNVTAVPAEQSVAPTSARWLTRGVVGSLSLFWCHAAAYALTLVLLLGEPPFPGVGPIVLSDERHFEWSRRLQHLGVGYGLPAFMSASWAAESWRSSGGNAPHSVLELAVAGYSEALRQRPWQGVFARDYAQFLRDTGRIDLDTRVAILETALRYNPTAPGVWLELVLQLEQEGRWEQSAQRWTPLWLDHCAFMAFNNHDAVAAVFARLPDSVAAEHPDAVERCRRWVENPPAARYL